MFVAFGLVFVILAVVVVITWVGTAFVGPVQYGSLEVTQQTAAPTLRP